MKKELLQLSFGQIVQSDAVTVITLQHKAQQFSICTDGSVGKAIQRLLAGLRNSRPSTYELLQSIIGGFSVRVKQVVINDFEDPIYFARLFLEVSCGKIRHILEIDARPSDTIVLALMNNAPILCTREVLEKANESADEITEGDF